MTEPWSPASWRSAIARQLPAYADSAALARVEATLGERPPLVDLAETDRLLTALAGVAEGKAFLLQGGDCAETIDRCDADSLRATLALIERMAAIIAAGVGVPVVRVGRMAGQFAKPRSADTERRDGTALPAYRGDGINGTGFAPDTRRPDPERMLLAHDHSAETIRLLRDRAAHGGPEPVYTSHEALLLPYEEGLVRREGGRDFASSGHLLWIGDRTRFPGSAHVEFARGIANPVAIKCGPGLDGETLARLLEALDPGRQAGRVTLITRLGSERVADRLAALIRAARSEGHPVVWSCDPMHGNTVAAADGRKTRRFDDLLAELRKTVAVHRAEGSRLGGLHVEMTGEDVTECTGGPGGLGEQDLAERYRSPCDPRLNADQAIALAGELAALFDKKRTTAAA